MVKVLRPNHLGRRAALAAAIVVAAAACLPAPARANFGISGFGVTAAEHDGSIDEQAGSHPYQMTTAVDFNLAAESLLQPGGPFTDGDVKDLQLELPPGLIENPSALPKCSQAQFNTPRSSPYEASLSGEDCPARTQIGVVAIHTSYAGGSTRTFGVFNLVPPPGYQSQFGFAPFGVPIAFTPKVRDAQGEYGLTLDLRDFSQRLDVYGFALTIWGTPWNLTHNTERGNCLNEANPEDPYAKCSPGRPRVNAPPQAYLSLPTSCAHPQTFTLLADSWQQPGGYLPDGDPDLSAAAWKSAISVAPAALSGCASLPFGPGVTSQPTTERVSSASGLHLHLEAGLEGLIEPTGRAFSQIRKAVVALPEGVTINPSLAAGLGVCTPAEYASEAASSPPGAGCPNAAKIGAVSLETPLLEGLVKGSVFLAQPYQNPSGSLLALYLIARSPERGLIVKVAGKVELNPATGQLVATFDDLPQLPYTHLNVDLREGQRAPLLTPSACGTYATQIALSPYQNPETALHEAPTFKLNKGIGAGEACPTGAAAPFEPGAVAGALNSFAGAYTPFYLHLTRTDSQQEITSYSAKLPPGLLGNLSGVPYCPQADIQAAQSETGTEETEHPSCPAASEIGHTETGYGVGLDLAYAPGRLYLAGPYHGAPLSVVAIDSATVGPFDLGVIVIRSAIEVNPRTAQVEIDSATSDPIPHIRDGIPLHLRDIRVYISRPDFTLNPTSCEPFSVTSTLTGSSAPFSNPKDIVASAADPFQVSFCSELGFAPKFGLTLKGGTKRGDYPTLTAVLTPHPGDANIASAAITLPPSLFLGQGHVREVCARPQLEAEACPPGSVYGHATAITPLLGEPMEGPVYLRSSSGALPDLVAVLHGAGIRIVLEGRIDSFHGGIRATFEGLPDAPVTKFTMTIYGGRKRGILVNAASLCASPQLATARLIGQNNTGEALRPQLGTACGRRARRRRAHPTKRGGTA